MDTRHETCYTEYMGGRCTGPLQQVLKAVCCCSALGKAWGDSRCEPCPKKGKKITPHIFNKFFMLPICKVVFMPNRNFIILYDKRFPSTKSINNPVGIGT